MKRIFEAIQTSPLLEGIDYDDFERMLSCLSVKTLHYQKDDMVLLSGSKVDFVGLIVSGSVKIFKEDQQGNTSMLTELSRSESFGEVFACAGISQSPVSIQATDDTEVFYIDFRRIITTCTATCPFHSRLIENMLKLIAIKDLMLNQKIEILSRRTTREKLLCYFDMQRGSASEFTIPFNREELAHYLCVDRSAMSNELGKMRDEGLISFHKNRFEILAN